MAPGVGEQVPDDLGDQIGVGAERSLGQGAGLDPIASTAKQAAQKRAGLDLLESRPHAEAELLEDLDEVGRLGQVADGGGLGDLEEDALRGDAGRLDLGEHVVEEGLVPTDCPERLMAKRVVSPWERVPQARVTKAAWTTQRSIEAIR